MVKVLYWNNCWFTNVGEAFIDLGAMELIKRIFGDVKIINISNMNYYYINKMHRENQLSLQMLNMWEYYKADYIVFAGMFATLEFINESWSMPAIQKLGNTGAKLVFLGLGQWDYTNIETEEFKRVINELKPVLISTRDDIVYDNFSEYANCIKGLDCAFWVKNVYDPRGVSSKKYEVITFNRSKCPTEVKPKYDVIKCWHFPYSMKRINLIDNMLVSDTPYDYLTVYANAERVTTDMVHGAIPSIQYGRHIKFLRVDKRGYAVDTVENMKIDNEGYCFVNEDDLEKQKGQIEDNIKNILKL